MDIHGREVDNEKLGELAFSCARLYKPTGSVSGRNAAEELRAAIHDINTAHALIERRFGKTASPPEACEWLLDNRYLALREAKTALHAISGQDGLRDRLARRLARRGSARDRGRETARRGPLA